MEVYDKAIHELCVDKTSCRHEHSLKTLRNKSDQNMQKNNLAESQPIEYLDKDQVKK